MNCSTKVLIVGAGAAGIAAASRLVEKGFTDFLILEAEDRIGGRVYTTTFGGSATIEKGSQWVHGEKGNVVFELANHLGLLEGSCVQCVGGGCVSDGSGKKVDAEDVDVYLDILQGIDDECEDAMRIYRGSVHDFFLQEYKKRLKNKGIDYDSSPRAGQFFQLFQRMRESADGCDSWTEVSCRGYTEFWTCEGNSLLSWKCGGYHNIIDILTRRYPDESRELPVRSKVLLKKEVTSIQWDGEDRVVTTCEDGSVYLSDHVLVTVSLGVLKHRCYSMFQPPLPAFKLTAIQGLGIGAVDKVFLLFPQQWWPDEEKFFSILWTSQAIKDFCLNEGDSSRHWLQGVFGFHPVDNAPSTLMTWVVGDYARIMERLPISTVMDGCMQLLKYFFGSIFNIPPATHVDRSVWGTNPHFRGSYSFRSVDGDALGATPALLAHPLVNSKGKPVVMFAGEATHEHYFSTVHGAVETGFREADRLGKLCGVVSDSPTKCCVVIVGAGVAGLAAARTLLEGGVTDFVLLEAQAQAGGRVQSVPVNGAWVEAGAQWIHGQNHAVWQLANDKGLLSDFISAEGEGPYLQEGGREVPLSVVQEVGGVVGDIMEQCCQFTEQEETTSVPGSVGAYLHTSFEKYLLGCGCDEEGRRLRWELYDWHLRFYVIDNSCMKLDNLSARAYGTYLFSGGRDYTNFKNGYSSFIQSLVEDLPAEKLHFNCPVSTICWKKEVPVKNGLCSRGSCSSTVLVSCVNDWRYEAEHVIVTCSLGYLKEHHTSMFQPGLPPTITQAIEDLGFATINKVFLIYDVPWWQPDSRGFQIVWSLHESDFFSTNESSEWLRDLSGFDVLPDHDAVLLGWVGGCGAEAVEELSEEVVGRHCTQLLRLFTGRPDVPLPRTTVRTQWHKNAYIRGGYSNNSNLCDKSCSKPSDLAQPVYTRVGDRERPTLLLAGEATHPHYYSTTHGAYETGHKQASCVLAYRHGDAPS